MKRFIVLSLSIIVFSFFGIANAEVVVDFQGTEFQTDVKKILSISDTDLVLFNIGLDSITNPQNISYWKVRLYCDDGLNIMMDATGDNNCGSAIKLDSLNNDSFFFLFQNKTNELKSFSFKLKAYDKNGKWLHTETENFRWK